MYDAAFGSSFFHWLRRKDSTPGNPNVAHETEFMQGLRRVLGTDARFAFNTTASNYEVEDPAYRGRQFTTRPLYLAFKKAIFGLQGKAVPEEGPKVLSHRTIARAAQENGFEIEQQQFAVLKFPPAALISQLFLEGYFLLDAEKLTADEKATIIKAAVQKAKTLSNPDDQQEELIAAQYVLKTR